MYVLRRKWGLVIDTLRETHGGQFPGTHARYVLRSPIEVLQTWRDVRGDATEEAGGGEAVVGHRGATPHSGTGGGFND